MSVVAGYRTSIAGTASGNIIPDADLTYTLGNASFRWLETFSGTYTFSGGQSLVGTTADVTTLARSTNNQLFVLGLATASYPAIGRNGTTLEVLLGSNNDYTGIKAKTLTLSASATTGIGAVNSNSIDLFSSGTPGRTGYFGTSVVSPLYTTSGYSSGARSTTSPILSATEAVTLSGATSATTNIIPAGATVEGIATTTTTTITGASGYQVGDGSDADRYGDITGTAVGTASGSTSYTADPRWWTAAARAVTLTAKTSNFTGGVVQVTVFYRTSVGA